MLCLHGKPAGTSTTKNGTFWHCDQPEKCHLMCLKDHAPLYDKCVKAFLATHQTRPKCCVSEKPNGCKTEIPEVAAERNYAKMKVVTDKENENYGRPFFVCSKENDQCHYFEWGDKCLVKRPVCEHGEPCELHTVEKEGPNYYKCFFCCPKPKNEACKFFMWSNEFHRTDLRDLWLRDDRYMSPLEKLLVDLSGNKKHSE